MAAGRSSRPATLLTAAGAAAVLVAGAVAWLSPGAAGTEQSAADGTRFWRYVTPVVSEIDVPQTVDELVKRSDAVVVARVSDVTDGREERGYYDPTPSDPRVPLPRTVFVHLTVDRVVRGPVTEQQVLTMEMYRPPRTVTIEDVRKHMPPGQMLFFLGNRAESAKRSGFTSPAVQLAEKDIWAPVSLSRAVIAQNPNGLYAALQPHEDATEFLASFDATTVTGAAERAARSPR